MVKVSTFFTSHGIISILMSKELFLAGKKRASRLFANLLGTLRTFDEKVKTENSAEKRAEIDKKVDERIATDRRKILVRYKL